MLPIESVVAVLERAAVERALTVYLRADPFRGVAPDLEGELTELLAPLRRSQAEEDAAALEQEAARVEAYLAAGPTGRRGVAVFSSGGGATFHALPLSFPVPPSAYWGDHFDLTPLQRALDRAERVFVLLVDRAGARVLRVLWGEVEEMTPLPPGMASSASVAALADAVLAPALDQGAEVLRREAAIGRVDRVVLGGADAALPALRARLGPALGARVQRCPQLRFGASPTEVLESVLELLWRSEQEREERLVGDLLRAAERGLAAVGPDAVVDALTAGDVRRLVVPEGLHLTGGECTACGRLAPAPAPTVCPVCGAPLREVRDWVERIEDRVTVGGGSVEELGGHAAAELAEHERIGAFLRHPRELPAGR